MVAEALWAAFLDMFKTKKWIVLVMEFGMVSLLALVGFCLPMSSYFLISIAVLWMMAFASATQDICIDGIYITSLNKKEQAKYVGIQGVFWNVGRIFSMAFIVYVASYFGEGRNIFLDDRLVRGGSRDVGFGWLPYLFTQGLSGGSP